MFYVKKGSPYQTIEDLKGKNLHSATIIGIVGAGGIGLHLYEQIRVLEWQQAAFLVLMVLITVAIIDAISQRLRMAIIGRRS